MYAFLKEFLIYVNAFFITYLIVYSSFLFVCVITGVLKLYRNKQEKKYNVGFKNKFYVPISIIVPGYNESVTIVDTVNSLLNLDYELYEIIVVNDGSTDDTKDKLIKAFDLKKVNKPVHKSLICKNIVSIYENDSKKVRITLVNKENGGKADALNAGINVSTYPYFASIDADSVLQYDALKEISYPILMNENVVAVGGLVRPSNNVTIKDARVLKYKMPKKIIECLQVVEYDRSFLASRVLFDKYNGSLIISGAFGLFKKDIVIKAGGYDANTIGEDMEIVVRLHEYCLLNDIDYKISYAPNAICWSQVPGNLKNLMKQRKRWHLGLYQSMKKHNNLFANFKYGEVSYISYFYFLIYELLSPFIEIFGVLTMVLAYFLDLLNIRYMIIFLLIYALYSSVLTLTAFITRIYTQDVRLSIFDFLKALLLCFFEVSFLRFILTFVRATAFVNYKKKKLDWGLLDRMQNNYE